MSEMSKITQDHVRRSAIVYVRQSSTTQVENNRESTARQYQLAERAVGLGWRRDQVRGQDTKRQFTHAKLAPTAIRRVRSTEASGANRYD